MLPGQEQRMPPLFGKLMKALTLLLPEHTQSILTRSGT